MFIALKSCNGIWPHICENVSPAPLCLGNENQTDEQSELSNRIKLFKRNKSSMTIILLEVNKGSTYLGTIKTSHKKYRN